MENLFDLVEYSKTLESLLEDEILGYDSLDFKVGDYFEVNRHEVISMPFGVEIKDTANSRDKLNLDGLYGEELNTCSCHIIVATGENYEADYEIWEPYKVYTIDDIRVDELGSINLVEQFLDLIDADDYSKVDKWCVS